MKQINKKTLYRVLWIVLLILFIVVYVIYFSHDEDENLLVIFGLITTIAGAVILLSPRVKDWADE